MPLYMKLMLQRNTESGNPKKNWDPLENTTAQKHKKLLKKARPSTRHQECFLRLRQKFTAERTQDLKNYYAWFFYLKLI